MKIDETSKMFHLSISTLRYYEKIGLLEDVERDKNGNRVYKYKDIERIDFVLCIKQTELD